MKRVLTALMFVALAVALVVLMRGQQGNPAVPEASAPDVDTSRSAPTPDADPSPNDEPSVDESSPEQQAGLAQPAPPVDARPARVLRLADGDSFDMVWLDTDERDEVRMFGINAPEANACFGGSAREVLQILTNDQDLLIETIERDEFGRVLGNVWVDELFINATMVELGAALALSDGGRYAGLITDAQSLARDSASGLWDPSACGADPAVDVRIESIQADAPGRDDQNKNGEWIVIQNAGDVAADMTGWSIRDESTRHRYSFPTAHFIEAGESTVVYSGCGDDTRDELYWCDRDPVWNNGGDTGFLVDPDGRFADSLSYSG